MKRITAGRKLTIFDVLWSVLTGVTHHPIDIPGSIFQNVVSAREYKGRGWGMLIKNELIRPPDEL